MHYIYKFYSFYICILIIMCFNVLEIVSAIHGRYTRDIDEYELSIPHRVTSQGEFISFSIPQYFKHNFRDRHKRDTIPEEHKLYYNIIFDGKVHHAELWPNHGFISPNIVTENYNHKLPVNQRVLKRMDRNKLCYYSGRVKGHKRSSAALSVCHGLTGYLTTDSGHYYIEPMAEHGPNENGEHVHVIYKRRLSDKTNSSGYPGFSPHRCGMTEKWEDGWNRELLRTAREDQRRGGRDKKRQLENLQHYLEVLMVADQRFLEHRQNIGPEQYIMTVMNMVSNYFHDASIGKAIDVTVVRIIYLNKPDEHLDLVLSENAEQTLENVCAWADKLNPPDISNPIHHDIAVLLTKYDLCSNNLTQCELMGLTRLGTVCNPHDACAINEDTGLTLGVTVTHEVGHLMGCDHDVGPPDSCTHDAGGGFNYIMSAGVQLATTQWSTCSKKYVDSLFANGLGDCLNDLPAASLYHDEMDMPPGAVYDVDYQCSMYIADSVHCNIVPTKFCMKIFCRPRAGDRTSCKANYDPPADGSKCGENKWCYNKKCVEMGQRPAAVDGGWGEWGPWTECTRSCGGGVQTMERECNNPAPLNKGRYCLGEKKKIKLCNTQVHCDASQPTFREQQCTKFDSEPYENKHYTWKPYILEDALCELNCINEENAFVTLAPRVIDGTACKPGSKDKCIGGKCQKIGCDDVIGSTAVEDVCGVCNGDGTHCEVTTKVFDGSGEGYTKVATIPAGSRHFRVAEKSASKNMLAIGADDESKFYLNGDNNEQPNGDYDFGGVIGVYDHPAEDIETIFIPGPLNKPLILYEVFVNKANPGLEYSYSEIRHAGQKAKPQYFWDFEEFEGCSARCGKGLKTSKPSCTEKTQGKVSDKFCDLAAKPEPKTMECFVRACQLKWNPSPWGKCSGCKNKAGVEERTLTCGIEAAQEGKDSIIVEDSFCTEAKPSTQQVCTSDQPCSKKRSYSEADRRIADLWHQLDFIKTKHHLYEKEAPMLAEVKEVQPEFIQIVDDEKSRKHLEPRYLGDLAKPTKKFVKKSIASSNQLSKHIKYFRKRNNVVHKCAPGNKSTANDKKGKFVKDHLLPEGQKMMEVPIKEKAGDVHLSDEAFEQAGDYIADTLDFCNAKNYTGKEADEKLAQQNDVHTTTASSDAIT